AHQYTPYFYASAARLLGGRAPILFTEHGRPFPDLPNKKRLIANRLLLRRRDRVVAVGEAVRQALRQNEGIPAGRIGVVYNGIDFEPFRRAADRAEARRELGAGPDDFAVIQVARLDPLKDHATALRALEQAVRRLPGLRLALVGDGPERASI